MSRILNVLIVVSSVAPLAQGAWLHLEIRDSLSGMAVVPGSLSVDGTEVADKVDTSGRLKLEIAAGDHQIIIQAQGYRQMNAHQMAIDENVPWTILLIDPLTSPSEVRQITTQSDSGTETTTLAGYVVDDKGGRPIPGAEVVVIDTDIRTQTNSGGFFVLNIPLADVGEVSRNSLGDTFVKRTIAVSKAGFGAHEQREVVLVGGDRRLYRFRLVPGQDGTAVDERRYRGKLQATHFDGHPPMKEEQAAEPAASIKTNDIGPSAQTAPTSIRVGRSCSCTSCSSVLTVSMETYTKHVLPSEWISSWRVDSLKAGAIAIRSYGAYYAYHPIAGTYDICDNACCQVYGTSTASSTDAAVDATAGIYLVDASLNIARSEYSAENNDKANRDGCGDCYTQNKPSDGICLYDPVCCGATQNGHGRGMCQWGSQRWALNQAKTYDWIVDHYYSAFGWTRQDLGTAAPTITQQPSASIVCPGAMATFTVTATGSGTLSYQWQKNSANLANGGHYSGVTTNTLTISNTDTNDVADYRCVVTNSGGNATSNQSSLSLRSPTVITQQPQSQDICPGITASFTVAATGDGTITWQWQKNGNNLSDGGHYSGVTTVTLTVATADSGDLGNYRCVATAGCGNATSDPASLALNGPAFAPGDFDKDGDVDQADFGHIQNCLSGNGLVQTDPSCEDAKLDGGNDVAANDVRIFLGCVSGSGITADHCCISP